MASVARLRAEVASVVESSASVAGLGPISSAQVVASGTVALLKTAREQMI